MQVNDIVLIWCYRGFRPAYVKTIGKRKALITWADGEQEWINTSRIKEPKNFKDRMWMEKALKTEKNLR